MIIFLSICHSELIENDKYYNQKYHITWSYSLVYMSYNKCMDHSNKCLLSQECFYIVYVLKMVAGK